MHRWIWEQLEHRPDYMRKRMFGSQAIYLYGRLMFCVSSKQEPWSGLLCATSREHHDSIRRDFPFLTPHPILGKWLYLSDADDSFEYRAQSVIEAIARGDRRFGVIPK